MKEYIYSVARIKAKETELLTSGDLEQLMAAEDYSAALRFLRDKGYSVSDGENSVIASEERSMWQLLSELADTDILNALRLPADYHNLKASLKSVYSETDGSELLTDNGTVDKELIYSSVVSRDYSELPSRFAQTAEKAMALLLRTHDGQICDIAVDTAMLDAMNAAADESKDSFLKRYITMKTDLSNLRTALRCVKTKKSGSFTDYALYHGGTLNIDLLKAAAESDIDRLYEYVESTAYGDLTDEMKKSGAAFERACDDRLTELADEAKYDCFSSAPIIAYYHAKQTELGAVRLILSAKKNRLDERLVRERVRKLYA